MPVGGDRVDRGELGVQRPGALGLDAGLERRAHVRVGAGEVHVVQQRAHVQPRAADGHGPVPARRDLVERGAGARLVVRDRRVLVRVEDVEQVVRDAAALRRPAASPCRCPCRGRAAWRRR